MVQTLIYTDLGELHRSIPTPSISWEMPSALCVNSPTPVGMSHWRNRLRRMAILLNLWEVLKRATGLQANSLI